MIHILDSQFMCGIFGYVGKRPEAAAIVLEGLKRLDYRGYDSWGIAALSDNKITIEKQIGKIANVKSNFQLSTLNSQLAIGHTRWATTGAVTQVNAHPHFSTDQSFILAQNGIVENYKELKEQLLKKGHTFHSETDTEVIVRLIEEKLKNDKDLQKAISHAFAELKGRNTIILATKDGQIFAARNGSPLVVGINEQTKDFYISSDTLSFAHDANKFVIIDNGTILRLNHSLKIFDIKSGRERPYKMEDVTIDSGKIDKEGFDHFMLKEIFEAPFVLNQLLKQDEKAYMQLASALKKARNVYTIGSGGAGVAAAQCAYYLRHFGRINAVSLIGADSAEYLELLSKDDIIIAISQSGETADVLEILEPAKKMGVTIASFVNMPGSMITRMSDYKFMSESGAEICVMSTKTFDAQVAFGYLLSKAVSGKLAEGKKNLRYLSDTIATYLMDKKNHETIKKIAKKLSQEEHIFLLGKSQNFHIIQEGMVKIIEAAYIHGHALPSGDLKHYVITLMEPGVPVIIAISNDEVKNDVINAVNEVKLRGAYVIGLAEENMSNFDYYLPIPQTDETSALMHLIPLQLLSYYMSIELGNDVDKPRNIAKSVTVK